MAKIIETGIPFQVNLFEYDCQVALKTRVPAGNSATHIYDLGNIAQELFQHRAQRFAEIPELFVGNQVLRLSSLRDFKICRV